jgi:hypothetical protein
VTTDEGLKADRKPWNPNGESVYEVQMGPTNETERVFVLFYVVATSVAEATSMGAKSYAYGPVTRVVCLGPVIRRSCAECN